MNLSQRAVSSEAALLRLGPPSVSCGGASSKDAVLCIGLTMTLHPFEVTA